MSADTVLIDSKDNVAVAVRELNEGEVISGIPGTEVTVLSNVPRNHKVAVKEIPAGSPVIKYGELIGHAEGTIRAGEWVHTHNLSSGED